MRFEYLNAAFNSDVKPSSRKFVLVALCDYAGASGLVFPTNQTLSWKTSQNHKTIERHLSALIADGFIVDTGLRKGKTGRVIVYQISMNRLLERGRVIPPKTGRLNTPKNGVVSEEVIPPKTEPNSPKNGAIKYPLNRGTEPPVLFNHQGTGGEGGDSVNVYKGTCARDSNQKTAPSTTQEKYPIPDDWKPEIRQVDMNHLRALGLTDDLFEKEIAAFSFHHRTNGQKRDAHNWNRSFTNSLKNILERRANDETRKRNNSIDFDSTDWDLPAGYIEAKSAGII